MKEETTVAVIVCGSMPGVLPAATTYPPAPQPALTPSPFSFSVASSRWSSRPSFHLSNLFLRSLALLLSFVSAFSLVAPSPTKKIGEQHFSFDKYPELMYSFIVTILAFLYSAYQLFKGVCDITYRGILISDMISDYISFTLDQLAGYLLVSSSSATILAIQQIERSTSLWKATIISVCMSFATFIVIAACALLSGFKLCKRIIW